MADAMLTPEEQKLLSQLEIKNAMGGVSSSEEQTLFNLRKKKKLQQAMQGNN